MSRIRFCASLIVALSCEQPRWVSSAAAPAETERADAGTRDAGGGPEDNPSSPAVALGSSIALGSSCVTSAQCDDGLDCTTDECDLEVLRCRSTPDNARCSDGQYCNGVEQCILQLGCRLGSPVSCSDATPCTVDSCDETTRDCVHSPRDVDGDGDPDGNCAGGTDCDDADPSVSGTAVDLCGNEVDDNCDGRVDEASCQLTLHDQCDDALRVEASGAFRLSFAGSTRSQSSRCFVAGDEVGGDLMLAVIVPEGPAQNLDVQLRSPGARLAIAEATICDGQATEGECVTGATLATGLGVARFRKSQAAPGEHLFALLSDTGREVDVDVAFQPGSPDAAKGSCEVPRLAPTDVPFVSSLSVVTLPREVDAGVAGEGLQSECGDFSNAEIFRFEVEATSDLRIFADPLDALGETRISLRSLGCESQAAESKCVEGSARPLTVRSVSPGSYLIAVAADGPNDVRVVIDVQPPAPAPPTDSCEGAPVLSHNTTRTLSFESHIDDVEAGCIPGAADAALSLNLDAESDVLVLGRFSSGDVGSLGLAGPECLRAEQLACTIGSNRPVRLARRGLPAGEHRIVVESNRGLPATVLAAVRPAAPTILVPAANGCVDALTIPVSGGFFEGNTLNATAEFTASCDFATPAGAPDQLLAFALDEPRRVILDARGSEFDVLLNLRRGPSCPGTEVDSGCSLSSGGVESFLDLELAAGDYFLQIDGYAGRSGRWSLNAFILDIDE